VSNSIHRQHALDDCLSRVMQMSGDDFCNISMKDKECLKKALMEIVLLREHLRDTREALEKIVALDDGDEPFAWKHADVFDSARAVLSDSGERPQSGEESAREPNSRNGCR
jgi:hypothetical protein